jgi:phenylpropionate dioxygenase-like ring-hydroxylating dioxygenase large terminal subunit
VSSSKVQLEDFWYIVARSEELPENKVLKRKILGEWLAVFRDIAGQPAALQDRCKHRASRLSAGSVQEGCVACPYHGWVYNAEGCVTAVPAEGVNYKASRNRRTPAYSTREQDGYIYVRLTKHPEVEFEPFPMPYYGQPGWDTIRVINRFRNNVTNCAENYIDVPHTVSVHPGIFRKSQGQEISMTVTRSHGEVHAVYRNEDSNLGWWTPFLNPSGQKIHHVDSFYMPNVTSVEYDLGPHRRFFITSQCIPEEYDSTLVYTDVTYDYGIWNKLARPFMRWTTQAIINQDLEALSIQQDVLEKYGEHFANTPADTIHVFVESIRNALKEGKDPRELPERSQEVSFWV